MMDPEEKDIMKAYNPPMIDEVEDLIKAIKKVVGEVWGTD